MKQNEIYNQKRTVSVDFTVMTDNPESDEMFSCYMPEIDVYFSARTEEDINKKASAFVKMWVDFFHEKNQSLRNAKK